MVKCSCIWFILLIVRFQNHHEMIFIGKVLWYSYFQAKLQVLMIVPSKKVELITFNVISHELSNLNINTVSEYKVARLK